jgi:hypothetical protein
MQIVAQLSSHWRPYYKYSSAVAFDAMFILPFTAMQCLGYMHVQIERYLGIVWWMRDELIL